jgi:hypothetical protein
VSWNCGHCDMLEGPKFAVQTWAAWVTREGLRSTSSPRSFSMVMSVCERGRVVCGSLASLWCCDVVVDVSVVWASVPRLA